MSFLLACPNCGSRPSEEFRFGGELRTAPDSEISAEAWRAYVFERANVKGAQREWWHHRLGCRRWFVAVRDTSTNTVLETGWLESSKSAGRSLRPGGVQDAEAR